MLTQDQLDGLAFPVVKVRYAGPTDYKGSRYIATLRGVSVHHSYDHALSASVNARHAAERCWWKYRQSLDVPVTDDEAPRLFIPGDLSRGSYCFTVVSASYLEAA